MNHRDEQIREQREGNQTDNKVFHKFPYSFSHQQAYHPPATKKSAMTAMKIKSFIDFDSGGEFVRHRFVAVVVQQPSPGKTRYE